MLGQVIFQDIPEAMLVVDPVDDKVVLSNQAAVKLWSDLGYADLSRSESCYFKGCLVHMVVLT